MHVHILGICGTFMAGLAVLAKQQGHHVTGSDEKVYPPMSTQLKEQGIKLYEGYSVQHLEPIPDCIIIGNAIKRGNAELEHILDRNLFYRSGPQWLAEEVLRHRWVLAVAGTHGKTTTSSMLAWILEYAGLTPGFLIGGIPKNFNVSARLGDLPFFVIEADEYDSAFFDKRSKFVHYRPRTAILNNLEYDHADIFPDLAAIEQQFHHLIRTIPQTGLIIQNSVDTNLKRVLEKGCWSPVQTFSINSNGDWEAVDISVDGGQFIVTYNDQIKGQVQWSLVGQHNVANGLAAIAAAQHAGVAVHIACNALSQFESVKRRLEIVVEVNGRIIYDDFAHHPTAIAETLSALRNKVGDFARILAVVDFASYTMRHGSHRDRIASVLELANRVYLKRPQESDWDLQDVKRALTCPAEIYLETDAIIKDLTEQSQPGDHILIMSNRGFEGIHGRLATVLKG